MTEHIVVVGHGMVSHRFVSTLGSRYADTDLAVTVIGDTCPATRSYLSGVNTAKSMARSDA